MYDEIDLVLVDRFLPAFLSKPRFGGIRLFEYLALALLVPACFRLLGWFGWLLRPAIAAVRRFRKAAVDVPSNPIPGSADSAAVDHRRRHLAESFSVIELPLRERVFWSGTAVGLITAAGVWGLLLLNGVIAERLPVPPGCEASGRRRSGGWRCCGSGAGSRMAWR